MLGQQISESSPLSLVSSKANRDHWRRKVNKSGGAELTWERSDRVREGFGRGVPNGEKF